MSIIEPRSATHRAHAQNTELLHTISMFFNGVNSPIAMEIVSAYNMFRIYYNILLTILKI